MLFTLEISLGLKINVTEQIFLISENIQSSENCLNRLNRPTGNKQT